jgi:7-cyano-7-deazaguanine synthase
LASALVLLSGGMDSAVCLYMAVADHGAGEVQALFFDWGQIALPEERRAAQSLCEAAGAGSPTIIRLDFPYRGALTTPGQAVPTGRSTQEIGEGGITPAFFPGRNLVMLAHAFGLAAADGIGIVYFGANAADHQGFPDCREPFLEAVEGAFRLGVDRPVVLALPVIGMSKPGIVRAGDSLGVPWDLTFSCYTPAEGKACGGCDACALREEAFGRDG